MPKPNTKISAQNKGITPGQPVEALSGEIGDFQFAFGEGKANRTSIIKHMIKKINIVVTLKLVSETGLILTKSKLR